MLENIQLDKIYFLDIETVPQFPNYEELPENLKKLWDDKSEKIKSTEEAQTPSDIYERAGIYAEFGKIICISIGIFKKENNKYLFRVKSFAGDDEEKVLTSFSSLLENYFKTNQNYLCAHNGKEFDFPYISRRMVIHGLEIPEPLDNWGKKPWETEHLLDTMHLWRFGDYKSYTSLNLMCAALNIPTPKDDISGKDVGHVYYQENDLPRIQKYCEKDVVAIARLVQKFKRLDLIEDAFIDFVD